MTKQDNSAFLDHVGEYLSKNDQDQAVEAFMKSHGFAPLYKGNTNVIRGWIKLLDDGNRYFLDVQHALFFYTICQKAEREATERGKLLVSADLAWCLGKLRGLGHPNEAMERRNGLAPPQDTK